MTLVVILAWLFQGVRKEVDIRTLHIMLKCPQIDLHSCLRPECSEGRGEHLMMGQTSTPCMLLRMERLTSCTSTSLFYTEVFSLWDSIRGIVTLLLYVCWVVLLAVPCDRTATASFSELEMVTPVHTNLTSLHLSTLLPSSSEFVLSLRSTPGCPRLTLACDGLSSGQRFTRRLRTRAHTFSVAFALLSQTWIEIA